jgi:type I restriction enzyme S subunit
MSSNRANNWRAGTLFDLVRLQRGHDLPEPTRRPGRVPVMGSAGLSGYHDEARAHGPGLVVGRSGASFGKVHYCPVDYWPLNTALFATDFTGNDPRYVYYALQTLDLTAFNSGSAQASLNRNFIASIPVKIPPKAEQLRIASVLGALEDKIDSNRRLAGLLETTAATLFRARFVDFVGVDEFEETKIGRVPRGWAVRALSSAFDLLPGGTPSTQVAGYWDGGIPWISVTDTVPGPYVLDTARTVTERALRERRLRLYPAETVVITARGTVGNVALIAKPMALNQSCYAIRGRDGIGQLYLYFLLHQVVDQLRAHSYGSVFSTITRRTFDSVAVAHPASDALASFELVSRPIFDWVLGLERESRTLGFVRDLLLPKLISGEIRVPDTQDPAEVIEPLADEPSEVR